MTDKKLLTSTIGVISALSFSLASVASEQPGPDLFEAEKLPAGFMTDQPHLGEGSCGEGSCGEGDDDKDEEGSCGEGSCGEEDDKDEEGACGEGTCGAA